MNEGYDSAVLTIGLYLADFAFQKALGNGLGLSRTAKGVLKVYVAVFCPIRCYEIPAGKRSHSKGVV